MDERRRRASFGKLSKDSEINGMRSHAHLTVDLVRDPFFICYDTMGLTLILPHQLSIAITGSRVYSDSARSLMTWNEKRRLKHLGVPRTNRFSM